MQIGCHLSTSKGFKGAAEAALKLGAESFQFFTKNPRAFRGKGPQDGPAGVALCREHGLVAVAHSPYITNLSTPDPELHEITVQSLVHDLQIAESCGAVGLVVHCGKHVEMGEEYGIRRMVETLEMILNTYEGPVPILLENTAGQGSELGTDLEQLLRIRDQVKQKDRIGFCFDTCHAFVAGQYDPAAWDQYARRMRETGYRDLLVAVHLNDARAPQGSRRDRHENLGKGFIGEAGIATILQSGIFAGLPVVLETPVEKQEAYGPEMAYARQLAAGPEHGIEGRE